MPHVDDRDDEHPFVVYGTMMRGLCDEPKLAQLGASFVRPVLTAPRYRMWSMDDGAYAAVCRLAEAGVSLSMELWSFTGPGLCALFLSYARPAFAFAWVELDDGARARAILAERYLVEGPGARDISETGGWRAFLAAREAPSRS